MIICPKKSDASWKKLVDELGEERAYVAWFRHGSKLPDVITAKTYLATKPAGYAFVAPAAVAPVPSILFHGGPKPTGPLNVPIFLTADREGAQWYKDNRGGESGQIGEYTAAIKNPLDIDTREGVKKLIQVARDAGVKVEIKGNIDGDGWDFFSPDIAKHSPYEGGEPADLVYIPAVREGLKKAGYDGLKLFDTLENTSIETYVALDSAQVKPVAPAPKEGLLGAGEVPFNLAPEVAKAGKSAVELAADKAAADAEAKKQAEFPLVEPAPLPPPPGKAQRDMVTLSDRIKAIDAALLKAKEKDRATLLEERLRIGAEMGYQPSIDALQQYHTDRERLNSTPDVNKIVLDIVKRRQVVKGNSIPIGIESDPAYEMHGEVKALKEFGVGFQYFKRGGKTLAQLGETIAEKLAENGVHNPDGSPIELHEGEVAQMIGKAFSEGPRAPLEPARIDVPLTRAAAAGDVPKPGEIPPVVPSAENPVHPPGSPEAKLDQAAQNLQNDAKPFAHGKVVEGLPTVDYRTLSLSDEEQPSPEMWAEAMSAQIDPEFLKKQGVAGRGGKGGNRAETRIAVALEGPDGQVVLTGLVKPQKTLNKAGFYDINEPAFQRMGTRDFDGKKREVRVGGDSPALVHEVVGEGWKPIAILHFDAEPGRIFETFADQAAFDAAWAKSDKTSGPGAKDVPRHAEAVVRNAMRDEATIQKDIDNLGRLLGEVKTPEEKDALNLQIIKLYDELNDVLNRGQNQLGEDEQNPFRQAETAQRLPLEAARAKEFQAVVGRARNQGMRVDLYAKAFFEQGSRQVIEGQMRELQQRLKTAATASQRAAIERQINQRGQRLSELQGAVGVAYTPWHIGLSLEDVQNANLGNFVSLLHEVSESLGQRLNPAMRGTITRAVNESLAELRATARKAAAETGVPLARETGALDLLSETLGQKLTAAGVPDAPSFVQSIIRWIKDLYYRTAMAAQAAFGREPNHQTALDWFENQIRREVFGDYDYRLGRLVDRFMPEPLVESTRRYQGHDMTPGGVVDYVDPFSGRLNQPRVLPDSSDAVNWNIAFRQGSDNMGGLDIPQPEADARVTGAAINKFLDPLLKLHEGIGGMEWEQFWKILGGKEDPKKTLETLERRTVGASTARVGGERMTSVMDTQASLEARRMMENLRAKAVKVAAKARETVETESDGLVDKAKAVNAMEADRRNSALHEEALSQDLKDMVKRFVKDYSEGLKTAETHGRLAEAVKQSEGLMESDEIPAHYQDVFKRILDGDVSVFDYVKAIARLDLPISDLTQGEILKAIRDNADSNETLKQLADNKPLAVALSALVRKNADRVDEIQLGWLRDTEQYRVIHEDLQAIRKATPEQLRAMLKNMAAQKKAVGLRERLKVKYLVRRRDLKTATARVDRATERMGIVERALPALHAEVDRMQQTGSGALSDWHPAEGARFIQMSLGDDGAWHRSTRILHFNPDGSAVDAGAVRSALYENKEWLKAKVKNAGGAHYEEVKRQTTRLAMLDLQRGYQTVYATWLDRLAQPLTAAAQNLGGRWGAEAARQIREWQNIMRLHGERVQENSRYWNHAYEAVAKSAGIEDLGVLSDQIYDPINHFIQTNPGLDEGPAIRRAIRAARARLTKEPAEDFNTKFETLLRATKTAADYFEQASRQHGNAVHDPRLKSGLRNAVPLGWFTTPRSLDGNLVMRLTRDMEKSGWKLEYRSEKDGKNVERKAVVGANTFGDLTAEDFSEQNTANASAALQPLFTPGIVHDWLEPFINKTDREVFSWDGEPISQMDAQEAWQGAGGNVLKWIDAMGHRIWENGGSNPENAPSVGEFRLSLLRQVDGLFGMEAKMAYDNSQVRDLFDPMGRKPLAMMEARLNDLLPAEHVNFQQFDPISSYRLLGQVAFHGAFGRNGEEMISALRQLSDEAAVMKAEYGALRGTTKNIRMAEAAARGLDYRELQKAGQRVADIGGLKHKLEAFYGVSNPSGPFSNVRLGMEALQFMQAQITDNPKVGMYGLVALFDRPLGQRSVGPASLKSTGRAVTSTFREGLGSILEAMNVHLMHTSDEIKDVAYAEGGTRNLPWSVALSNSGPRAQFQNSVVGRFFLKPLQMMKVIERKGIKIGLGAGERDFDRLTLIPGLGGGNWLARIAARGDVEAQLRQVEAMISRGIQHFSNNRDDVQNPAFRFNAKQLGLGRFDKGVYDYWRNKSVEYGLGNLEDMVKNAMPAAAKGERILTKDQVIRIAQMTADIFRGEASISTQPSFLTENKLLKWAIPLLRWPIHQIHHVHEGLSTVEGRATFSSVAKGLGILALWNLPVGLAFSMAIDQYDERLLGKHSRLPNIDPLAQIPGIGPVLALADTNHEIPQEMMAWLVRGARSGQVYGLGADLAAGFVAPFDPTSGQRQFSLDQRVLVMSQIMNASQAVRNLLGQHWQTSWASFWKPLLTSIGGNGMLQTIDMANNALGLDNAEARQVMRINAANWLWSAGTENGMELRTGAGVGTGSPMSMWTREMLTAAMAGDNLGFLQAHQKALEAARKVVGDDPKIPMMQREQEAERRVLESWRSRNPLEVFRNRPTPAQMAQLYATMNDDGQRDVREALTRFDAFSRLITPTQAQRQMTQQFNRLTRPPRLRAPTMGLLFSP